MDNAIVCSSSLVIVCTWKAIYRSTSHHGKNVLYCCNFRDYSGQFGTYCININNLMLLCVFIESAGIFHINPALFISDHLIKKRFYTYCPPQGVKVTHIALFCAFRHVPLSTTDEK